MTYSSDVLDEQPSLVVVQLSESFAELWNHLASDLNVDLRIVDRESVSSAQRQVAAVLLTAGGVEREVLEWLGRHDRPHAIPLLAIGSDPCRRLAVQLVAAGATDYFALPADVEVLRNTLASAVDRHRVQLRNLCEARHPIRSEAFAAIVGESVAIREVMARAERLLPHDGATAFISGETGTGKELLARGIHEGSPRAAAPFVAVNCSALPEHLVESELFGHERGAFTDAHAAKPGLFEVADGGTLFLDEVGTLPTKLQAKLLRVLEDKEIRRIGGTKTRRVDVRVIAATNDNLTAALEAGTFRQDLYFRLGVVTLSLPPLRERGDDVLLIAEVLLERLAAEHSVAQPALTAEVERALRAHGWPGNIRELKNALERSLLLSPPGTLEMSELFPSAPVHVPANGPLPFPASLEKITAAAVHAMLELSDGNRSEAARRLEISRKRLRRLLNGDLSSK